MTNRLKGKNILITGGAGFIGAHVVNELVRMQHTVIVLDDLSGGFEANAGLFFVVFGAFLFFKYIHRI